MGIKSIARIPRLLPLATAVLASVLLLVAACSDDGADEGQPDGSATTTAAATTPPAASPDESDDSPTPISLPTTTVVFTNSAGERVELQVEIADEPGERSVGLMFRESMPEDAGMIFLYEEDHLGSFYMKNTFIPLSIAFVDAGGTIVDIQDMEPETVETHRPPEPYRNAIETNQGWFERNGIDVGDTVDIP